MVTVIEFLSSIDYRVAAETPLEGPDGLWADELLRQAGKR